jgi:two-component system cell cycle sensor histidine kinase/response regulator CckA
MTEPPLILCVSPADGYAVGPILEKAGYRVCPAGTGTDALRCAAELPALVVVSPGLPDTSATDLCRRLKADPHTGSLPVILLADPARNGAELAPPAGLADAFFVLPVHPAELTAAAVALLRQKQTADRLRESEERFRQMTESIREVFWMSDAQSKRLLYVSPAYEEIWGRSCQTLYDDPNSWQDTLHPDDRARILGDMRKRVKHGGHDTQFRIVRPDGGVRWIWDRSFPVCDEEGRVYRFVGIAEDITERKRLEEQFRQAQKMEAVGRLAGGVAHDFNNMLTAITGYSDLIRADSDPAAAVFRNAEEIRKAAQRAATLTRQLLAYSRHQVLAPRVVNLNTVVADLEKMLRRLISEEVTLSLRLDPALRRIEAEPGQLEQVIMNLSVNATDAMPQGGSLTIGTANAELDEAYAWAHADVQPGAYALLTVADTGHGMTDAVKARLFEPFFTTKAPGKGTGLGLATVYGIVKANGGHIEVETAPGRGTTFKVYFPQVMENARPDQGEARPAGPATGTETILLVEDEEVVRNLTRTVLQRNGYRVLEACHGVEALDLCRQHGGPIHLLVTDVVMPQMNGRDLAQRLARFRPETKVLFMSGYTGFLDEPLGLPDGSAAFLQKPFAPDALVRQVRTLLDA